MQDGNPRDDAGSSAPSPGDSTVTSVGALMEERRRYELWLGALNARRAETPKHVFARVHADYTARLEAVMGRLTGQVEGLRGELTTLATRIANLEEQQHRAKDARAEAELRAHVGEMTAAEWDRAAKEADEAIEELVRQHASAVDALKRTREFLAEAERPATPAAAAAPVPANSGNSTAPPGASSSPDIPLQAPRGTTNVPVQGTSPRLRPLPGREDANAAASARPVSDSAEGDLHVPAAGGGGFDELAFLSSVVEEGGSSPAPRAQPPATAAANVQPVARPAPPPAQPQAPPPPSRNPFVQRAQDKIINNDGVAGPKIESKKVGGRSGLAANVSGNNPIVLRDKSNEASKTLKCGECGAMNYATEWYCERCGAELASM
jgi:hypothetical protein